MEISSIAHTTRVTLGQSAIADRYLAGDPPSLAMAGQATNTTALVRASQRFHLQAYSFV